jgi:beta-glucanase (GH16 family)
MVLLSLLTLAAAAQPPGRGWVLSFEDQFNDTALDTTKWSVGYGWGDRTDWTREIIDSRYVLVKDGKLLLMAEPTGDGDYWAGAVNTKNKFSQEYGYFEARIKAAPGQGVLSGWWGKRNTEEWPPEIDIAEIFGAVNPKGDSTLGPWKTSMNVHYVPEGQKRQEDQTAYTLPGGKLFTEDFYTLAVEWTPTELNWYVDGKKVKSTTQGVQYLNQPFYWMLNLHICSKTIDWPGCPDERNEWPVAMEIDWVKAWKKPMKEKRARKAATAGQ